MNLQPLVSPCHNLALLQYLWPVSHLMPLSFSLHYYPVQLCLSALMQATQVEFSLDSSGSNINRKTATLAMFLLPIEQKKYCQYFFGIHFSTLISQRTESKRPACFYWQPKDRTTLEWWKRLILKVQLKGIVWWGEKNLMVMEFYCFQETKNWNV